MLGRDIPHWRIASMLLCARMFDDTPNMHAVPSDRLHGMQYTEIADEIDAKAAALYFEVATLAKLFSETQFLGDHRNFPHAHFGYLMACMGQIDLMSKCEHGDGAEPQGGQSARMQSFMERYLDAQKVDEHRVAIQLMRHTLMHTGALRYLYEQSTQTAYTWRIHFGDTFPGQVGHYTLSDETSNYQDDVINAVTGNVATVKALNLQLTAFAGDIERVARAYTAALRSDPSLQAKCEAVYPTIRVQSLRS
jgi:hypothetical protein